MQLFLIYIPLLLTQFHLQTTQIYTWEQYGLSVSAPANLEESEDADIWEIEDENLDFWLDGERIPFSDEEEEVYSSDAKTGAFKASEFMGYEGFKDGGPVPNVPEGHFVIGTEDGYEIFYILILDRKNKAAYELILEFIPQNKPAAIQLINSLRFN